MKSLKNMNIQELSWTFLDFHGLSWTFINFHELSWTWNHETLQLRVDCAAMDHRLNATEFCKIMKFQLFWVSTMRGCESLVLGSFFWQRACPGFESFASWKHDRENWKADFKVDALRESKVATQSSAVKSWYLDCAIISQCVAAQGRVVCGLFFEAVSAVTALRIAKTWPDAATKKNSGCDFAKRGRPWAHVQKPSQW